MRYYITPSDASAIEDVTATVRSQLYGYDLLMAGKLNANLAELEGTPRVEAIADELVVVGLEEMGLHLLLRCKLWFQDRCKCSMIRDGREVRSWTDYILGTDRRLFQDVAVPNHTTFTPILKPQLKT